MSTGIIPPIPQRVPEKPTAEAAPVLQLALPEQKSELDSNLSFDVQKLAFETVGNIGAQIRTKIEPLLVRDSSKKVQLIYLDRMLRGGLDLLSATASQLVNLTAAFQNAGQIATDGLTEFHKARPRPSDILNTDEAVIADAQAAAPGPPNFSLSGPQSALNILGLLATESHFFGRAVTIPEEPFLLELSAQLRQLPNVTIFHPALFTPWSKRAAFTLPASIETAFDSVMAARNQALRPVKRLMAEAAALKPDDPLYLEVRFASDQAREQYESADSLLRELNTRLSQKDDSAGATGMQMLVRAASIVDIFETSGTVTYLLLARMEAAGGAYRVVRSLSRLIFGGDGVDYAAGVIASFGLFNLQGQLLESGIVTERTTFRAIQKPAFFMDVLAPAVILIVLILVLSWFLSGKIRS